jgi:hypothetical protein
MSINEFELERPTPAQLRERAKIEQRVKKEESKPIPHPDDFRLTGSNRPADIPNQRSLF